MHEITVGSVTVQVVRKAIKNLHLGVYPPHGRVRVAAPLAVHDDAVRLAVIGKLGWIKRQQAKFEAQPRQSPRAMVGGETHYFFGRAHRLRVVEGTGPAEVLACARGFIELAAPPRSTEAERQEAIHRWYRRALQERIPPLLEKWQRALGVEVTAWGIKRMKTRWGTCNPTARRIWLNLELAKQPERCLEYLVVHELTHLRERTHGPRFIALMDAHMPEWRSHRRALAEGPLAHETWSC
jgi:predicted metal-dependent hydrolase